MALVVETGSGMANADAYVDEAYVSAYAAKFGLTWTVGAAAQEIAVRKATQYIDVAYEQRTVGRRFVNTQALAWPRSGVYDRDGYYQVESVLPEELKEATAEAAVKALAGTDLVPDLVNPGNLTERSVQVGPISKSESWSGGSGRSQITYYRKIDLLLARWLRSSTVLVRA